MIGFEEKIRNTIVNMIKFFVIIGVLIGVFSLFEGEGLEKNPIISILLKLLLPFALNYLIWRIAEHVNSKDKYSENVKKIVCTFMLCSLGGVIGIFYNCFTVLWCAPMVMAMISCIFCDKGLLQKLVIYSGAFSLIALLEIILEHPEEKSFFIRQGVIVLGMDVLIAMIAFNMVKYTTEMVEKISNSSKQLETDALTGLHSRPYIYEKAQSIVYTAKKDNPISVAILDLDHFKHVNDTYGHENGDIVLRTFGRLISKYMNEKITAGRFGGEEFLLLFDNMSSDEAYECLDRMRKEFSEIGYEFSNENVTFSSGLVTITSPLPFKQLFTLADNALYRSKENGRNQITVNKFR